MRLLLLHPELPSCGDCQRWLYDEQWRPVERAGQQVARPAGAVTPCWRCPKIIKGDVPHPSNAVELSEVNRQAYQHYRRCKAVLRFPADSIVEPNAGWIRLVEDEVDSQQQMLTLTYLMKGLFGGYRA